MKIAQRLLALEKKACEAIDGTAPGTSLVRVPGVERGMMWGLGLGHMAHPKRFFYAPTIIGCILKAEKAFGKEQG
jgi:hypothetical protein